MNFIYLCIAILVLAARHGAWASQENVRDLAEYYHTFSSESLGLPNPDAAIGNPLKGLVESPYYNWPPYQADIPLSVEFYYIGKTSSSWLLAAAAESSNT